MFDKLKIFIANLKCKHYWVNVVVRKTNETIPNKYYCKKCGGYYLNGYYAFGFFGVGNGLVGDPPTKINSG